MTANNALPPYIAHGGIYMFTFIGGGFVATDMIIVDVCVGGSGGLSVVDAIDIVVSRTDSVLKALTAHQIPTLFSERD